MNKVAILNRFFSLSFFFLTVQTFAQPQPGSVTVSASAPNPFTVVHRAPDSKIWQSAIIITNLEGDVSTNYQSYTELATGLCYTNAAGYLADTVEEVVSMDNGAEAIQGPHKVQWAYDTDTPGGLVNIQTPDGKQISCTPFGLAYYDLSSGSNAALGRLQYSTGVILPLNQVVYQNAFSNLTADVLYTYTKAGLSQDIVLRQALPPPDAFGLSDSNTVLQVYSQFINSPEPTATAVTNEGVLDDEVLNFGAMQMGVGTSLFIDDNEASLTVGSVGKQWIHVSTNTYLIESVPWTSISNQLGQMPHASNLNPRKASIRGLALLDEEPKARDARKPSKEKSTMKLAKATISGRRLVVDYNLSGTSSNLTLQGDTTYLVTSTVNVTNLLTIEGGSVVKFTNLAQINVTGPASNIVCQTGPYSPSVWTSINDNSVGATVTGSTGTPLVATNTYLNFTVVSNQPMTLRYLRFSYASTAIAGAITVGSGASDWIKVWDCQFFDCTTGFASTPNEPTSLYLYNVLFSAVTYGVSTGTSNGSMTIGAANVTGDAMNSFAYNINGAKLSATNCLFTAVTNMPWVSLWTDCQSNLNGLGVYQPAGGAGYYLTNGTGSKGASLKNAGTSKIDANLLLDLATLTTYPPGVIQGSIAVNSNLTTNVPRNTGIPDIGYHYPPLDWAINATVSATITVQPGTALGMFGSNSGIYLQAGGVLNCTGTAASPVYITRYNTVQEQSRTNWASANWIGSVEVPDNSGQVISSVFTDWSVLASDGQLNCSAATATPQFGFQSCQFYAGQIYISGGSVSSTNSLYRRVAIQLRDIFRNANTYYNNLFWQGSLLYNHTSSGVWTFRENLFDQDIITNLAAVNIEVCSNNAYATNLISQPTTLLTPTNGAVILANSPAYFIGGFGQFYYPVTQTNLINKGSRSATAAGLTNYTTCINNIADGGGTNLVSIGYHFPSQPPTITSQPTNQVTTNGGSATFSVGATGTGTLTYQWYFNGMPLSSQTGSSLMISSVAASNAGMYEVIVTDPLGSTASYLVTLKAAQNDFYVNYFSSSAISPMMRGTGDSYFNYLNNANLIATATTNGSLRGVQPGLDANTYNWKNLTSQAIAGNSSFAPATTLELQQVAETNGASLVFTVNCVGDGYANGSGLWVLTNTNTSFLASLAADWVQYANNIVNNYIISNSVVLTYPGGSPTIPSGDWAIITNLQTNWTWVSGGMTNHFPVLQQWNSYTKLPKVKYWEIGNENDNMGLSTTIFTTNLDTNLSSSGYAAVYTSISAAMRSNDASILIGPGFGGNDGGNTNIGPLLADSAAGVDFMVHHPYPANVDLYLTNAVVNLPALLTNLETIRSSQDLLRSQMYYYSALYHRSMSVPLLATEWNGSDQSSDDEVDFSMWALLADTETLFSMVEGQQTLGANYYFDGGDPHRGSSWPLLFSQFQSNLGNYYLSSSVGDTVQCLFGGSNTEGSVTSPFRAYSTMASNGAGGVTLSVWMLNLNYSTNLTVDLHFPGPISGGTNYTLVCTNTTNSYAFQGTYGSGDIYWSNSVISATNGAAMVQVIPPATVMVAQVALLTAPVPPKVPVITPMPSPQGQPGQVITINGNNFSPNAQQNIVYFGPVRGTVLGATATSLNVTVPYGASYAPITVTVSNLTAYSMTYFNPAYFDASVSNPIVMQAVATNALADPIEGGNMNLADLGLMDINGDGKPDLMFLGGYWSNSIELNFGSVALYLNGSAGSGNFGLATNSPFTLPANYNPSFLAFGDFDGDGLPDWAWVDVNDIIVCGNASTPQSGAASSRFSQYNAGNGAYDIKVADFDGDGKPDIVVGNTTDGTVSVFRNISSGTGNIVFAQKVDFTACTNVQRFVVADFNGDGKPDIAVVGNTISGANFFILTNKSTLGNISFSAPIAIDSINDPDAIAVGDFNMDGKLDIAVGSDGNQDVLIYINNGIGGNVSFNSNIIAANFTHLGDPQEIAVADFNGDGLPDLAVVNAGSDMYTFQNVWTGGAFGALSFGPITTNVTGSGTVISVSAVSADMDLDGRPDILVGNYGKTNVVTFQNISQY